MTIIITPPPPPPRCPHCNEKLPGWSRPTDMTFAGFLCGGAVAVAFLLFMAGLMFGSYTLYGQPRDCLQSYIDYSPKYLGCKAHHFFATPVNKKEGLK
jgi:hypothetical protein